MQQSITVLKSTGNSIRVISNTREANTQNIFSKFISWCDEQEKSRMLWLGLSYLGIIGMALPCALFAVLFLGGNNFSLIVTVAVVNVPVLALNLAAQGTKITLPLFFFALLVDVIVILYSFIWFLYH